MTLGMLLLELLADVPRRCLLPRKEFLGVHDHTITRQGKSPTQGVPAEQNLVRGQTNRSGIPPPKLDHLHFWGCHDLRQALLTYPTATVCYTDGSDDQKNERPSGCAATFNTAPPITICNTSPIKGSYPAEIFAIILTTLLRSLPTLPQPMIFAIDNLSVCTTLQLIQQTKWNPFTASSNPICLWYSHIWTFLHSSPLRIIFTWIKGHADFPGNDYSDAISKWAPNNINYPPRSHQPNSTYFIYHHSQVRYPLNLSNTYSLHTLKITYTSP